MDKWVHTCLDGCSCHLCDPDPDLCHCISDGQPPCADPDLTAALDPYQGPGLCHRDAALAPDCCAACHLAAAQDPGWDEEADLCTDRAGAK